MTIVRYWLKHANSQTNEANLRDTKCQKIMIISREQNRIFCTRQTTAQSQTILCIHTSPAAIPIVVSNNVM